MRLGHSCLIKLSFVKGWQKDETTQQQAWFTGLIASAVTTEGDSIAAFTSCTCLSVETALTGTRLLLSLRTVITRKSFKIFSLKQEKHNVIKLLTQSKLDGIVNVIPQAI